MKTRNLIRVLVIAAIVLSFAVGAYAQSGNVVISSNTSWPAVTYNLNTLRVTNGATLTLQGANTSAQMNGQWAGYGVTIYAVSVEVDADSKISADGQGYTGGATGASGNGPGGGAGSILYDSVGGSHAGLGSTGTGTLSPGPTYGSSPTPTDLGSGGGGATRCAGGVCASDAAGGNGGGAIRLIISGKLTLNGTISANGTPAPANWPPSADSYAGGGSGGSIWVTTGTLGGTGRFIANGAPRYWNDQPVWPSGGGGRVAVYYGVDLFFTDSFTGFESSTATGGPGAQNGTVGFINTTYNNLMVVGGQIFTYPQDSSIVLNDIYVGSGASLVIGGGSVVNAGGAVGVTENSKLILQGKSTGEQVNGVWAGQGVTISAANVYVAPGSMITAAGQGYLGGPTGGNGRGPGGGGGSSLYDSQGGSYGGIGYASAGPTYGDQFAPTDLGSGAGGATRCAGGVCATDPAGGNGGGAIRLIVSGSLVNNGTISAEGGSAPPNWPPSPDTYADAGAGGSIWATVGTLSGSGVFTVNGGQRYWNGAATAGGGGGGRIAIYYEANDFAGTVTANGGLGAQAGTAAMFSTSGNDLVVNGGQTFVIPPDTSPNFGSVTVENGSTLILGGSSTLNVANELWVTGNSRIVLQGKNTAWEVNGAWAGQGATITAATVNVDYGSVITADAQGYTGGQTGQPGNGPGGGGGTIVYDSAAGSYGGLGVSTSCCSAGPTYGSATEPMDLGSGGGGASNSLGGNGGGAIRLIVGGTLTNNGLISASGGSGGIYAGAGSGGSIWATVASLTGSGTLAANGGSRVIDEVPAWPGGGGGRIAIYYTDDLGYGSLQVNGGVGAQPGTTFVKKAVRVTIGTNPVGLSFTVDGTTYTQMQFLSWEEGSEHTIGTSSPQAGNGMQSAFSHWSDLGAISHTVIASADNAVFVALFDTQYQLTTGAVPAGAGTVTPPSGNFYNAGSVVNVSAMPNAGYVFDHWSGQVADVNSPATTVTMSVQRTVTAVFTSSTVQVTVDTNPAGLSYIVDGTVYNSAQAFTWSVGTEHTIAAATPQGGGGTRHVFANWSDGGALSHSITVPANATTYRASFATQYQLTTAVLPAGSGTIGLSPTSPDGYYDSGVAVQLTASPNAGYVFADWSADLTGSTNPQSLTMTAPHLATANFSAVTGVTITTNPVGRSFTVDGISYSSTQTFSWVAGSNHTIATTSPQSGGAATRYIFANWSDSGAMSHSITAPANATTYTANYTTQYQLTIAVSPVGGGTVSTSPGSADSFFDAGTPVHVTASSNSGFGFANWTGDVAGTLNPETIAMLAPQSVVANFFPLVTITTNPLGRTFSVDGVSYSSAQTFAWAVGSNHTIATTSPQSGTAGTRYVFANWSDGSAISHSITVPANAITYIASFTTQYQLTTAASPVGGGTISALPASVDGFYDAATVVRLTASPNSGYSFANWSGDLSGATNPQNIAMAAPHAVTANFSAVPPDFRLNIAANGSASDSIKAGQTAVYKMTLTATGGFSGAVRFSCSLPLELTLASCSVSPAQPTVSGTSVVAVKMSVATTAPSRGMLFHPGTPSGTYNLIVTGTSGGIVHSQPLTLIVK